ncbi:type II secretion system major pseudopilin GspG [Chitinimonas sp. BJB300]|uniref:type II secretion system major pseudopilin GspG n=1 Tax=Chitinimonas sp. BJB300 TaxID=1559339 RepID=UPI000C0CD455|nr:type II secretion system major pseudopilin GspG [Chitinimonas sp. BJB300]PHV11013.1 type II secretion system protein GspG [Chitinimonas sp. BJB300]TSJ87016.1 type II secretion system protein GspG [Chitinimonas sp. BJB300]
MQFVRSKGFTLLELLVVVAIIGLLAAYVGPRYFSQIGKSEQTIARAQVEAFAKALDAYRVDVGNYPTSEQGLNALVTRPAELSKWNGPYMPKILPLDPWGRAYLYRALSPSEYDLLSYGKDGVPGGSGDDADIASR